ncbi:hypothetical protein C8J57DRAFT_1235892 [Mycena rebaudengoi]|nr:hypothetical protein C8J57DRAFT_1235892 [Mycena rebaudengoi]
MPVDQQTPWNIRSYDDDIDTADQARPVLPEAGEVKAAYQYARVATLSKYIPALNKEILRDGMAERSRILKRQLAVSVLVLAANLAGTIWVNTTYPPDRHGIGTFLYGDCTRISRISTAIHVVLNVLSGLLLGAGSYCMQLLVSPTRHEVDIAHARGAALDIGVPSVTNLPHIDCKRLVGWLALAVTATLLNFFWNSTIFTSVPVVSIPRALATSDFLEAGDNWSKTDPVASSLTKAMNMTRLEPKDCIYESLDPLSSTRSVLVVAKNMTSAQNNGSSLLNGWMSGWDFWHIGNYWLCSVYDPKHQKHHDWLVCNQRWADSLGDEWAVQVGPMNYPKDDPGGIPNILVDYCLVGDAANNEGRCGLHHSIHIMIVVCACTVVEFMLLLWTAFYFRKRGNLKAGLAGKRQRNLVTMGDAISDFLEEPDVRIGNKTTRGGYKLKDANWVECRVSWFKATSLHMWAFSIVLFAAALIAFPSGLVGSFMVNLESTGVDMDLPSIWRQGFKAHAYLVGHLPWVPEHRARVADLISNILMANAPQVAVSFIYLFYNNILTRQLAADEWVQFVRPSGKKALRVSAPAGMQRSSHFLSLPMRYGVPFMANSIVLHSFISQGIFVLQTSSFGPGPDGVRQPEFDDVTCRGYSALGIILALIVATISVLVLIIHSFIRTYRDIPPGFQLLGSSSAAIGLMCQRPEGDTDAHLFPVRMGIVSDPETDKKGVAGRLVFSTDIDLGQPMANENYIQPILVPPLPRPKKIWLDPPEESLQITRSTARARDSRIQKEIWNIANKAYPRVEPPAEIFRKLDKLFKAGRDLKTPNRIWKDAPGKQL